MMGSKRHWLGWMRDARRFSWLLAALLILSQGLFLFESAAEPVGSPGSGVIEVATLPAHPSECTLSKPDGGSLVPALVRSSAVVERPFPAAGFAVPTPRVSVAPFGASPSFRTTVSHLRV